MQITQTLILSMKIVRLLPPQSLNALRAKRGGGALKRRRPRSNSNEAESKRVGVSSGAGNGVPSRRRFSSFSTSREESSVRDGILGSASAVRFEIDKIEASLVDDDTEEALALIQCLRQEVDRLATESCRLQRASKSVNNCVSVVNAATQTVVKYGLDKSSVNAEIRRELESGVDDERLLHLVRSNWPKEAFRKVNIINKIDDSNDKVLVIVHDIKQKLRKLFGNAPLTGDRFKRGSVQPGQLLVEPREVQTRLGGDVDVNPRTVLTLAFNSGSMDDTFKQLLAGIRKVREVMSDKFCFATHSAPVGEILRKILEHECRNQEDGIPLYVEKPIIRKKVVMKEPPSKTMVVRAEGKTYVDLFRKVKQKVTREEAWEVLSVRRVGNRE